MDAPGRFAVCARLAAVAVLVGFGGLGACGGGTPEVRSVVLIVIDTLRADHLGTYGYGVHPTTPELDRLSRDGLVFEQAWSTSPWTLPSFGSLYTGLLPSRHRAGVVATVVDGRRGFEPLSSTAVTAAELFRDAGLRTGAIVNNPFLSRDFGVDRGFDDYDHEGGGNRELRRADVVVDRALDWIAARGGERFFLVVHLFDPHMDYDPDASVRGTFTDGLESSLRLPITNLRGLRSDVASLSAADREFVHAAYDEEVLFVDRQVGRLFAGLSEAGVLADGLVVLTADHGEELFEHGGFEHGHAMWDELLHVPLIAWGAGVQPGRTATPVSIADVARTVLDAAGVAAPRSTGKMGGRSLWPHVSRGAPLAEGPLVAEGLLYGPPELEALRAGGWKLIRDPAGTRAALYDLSGDPAERVDRAGDEPARAAALAHELELRLAAARHGATSAGEADVTPEMRAKLEDLGYTD